MIWLFASMAVAYVGSCLLAFFPFCRRKSDPLPPFPFKQMALFWSFSIAGG